MVCEEKKGILTEEQRKKLLAKRKYMSEHPEEAIREMVKKDDGYAPKGIMPEEKETTLFNENMSSNEARWVFFKSIDGKSEAEIAEIKKAYSEILPKILEKEFKLAQEGWML